MTTHFYQNYLIYKTEQFIPHNNMKMKKGGRVTMISWRRHLTSKCLIRSWQRLTLSALFSFPKKVLNHDVINRNKFIRWRRKIYLARMASFSYPSILNLFKAEREELKYNFLTESKRIELN